MMEKLGKQLLNIQESHPFLCSQLWGHSCWHLQYTTRDIVWCKSRVPSQRCRTWHAWGIIGSLISSTRPTSSVWWLDVPNTTTIPTIAGQQTICFFKGFHIGIAHFISKKGPWRSSYVQSGDVKPSVVALRPKTPRKVFLPGKPWKKSGPEMFGGARSRYQAGCEKIRHIS